MLSLYRISNNSYIKDKLNYTKEEYLLNFLNSFYVNQFQSNNNSYNYYNDNVILIYANNVNDDLFNWLLNELPEHAKAIYNKNQSKFDNIKLPKVNINKHILNNTNASINSSTESLLSYLNKTNILVDSIEIYENIYLINGNLNNAQSFKKCFNDCLELISSVNLVKDSYIANMPVYFVEDDYIHEVSSLEILLDSLDAKTNNIADFITLYDHPDKYVQNTLAGGNPEIKDSGRGTFFTTKNNSFGENTIVKITRPIYHTKHHHFKLTNSTTMTFATILSNLSNKLIQSSILNNVSHSSHPSDYQMWKDILKDKSFILASPIPSLANHGELFYLATNIELN